MVDGNGGQDAGQDFSSMHKLISLHGVVSSISVDKFAERHARKDCIYDFATSTGDVTPSKP